MSQIYKLHLLDIDNSIKIVYVFSGDYFNYNNDAPINLTNLFQNEPLNTIFTEIFSKEELDEIQKSKVPVVFSKWQLFPDDNIATIKLKIIDTMQYTVSVDEIYLFNMATKQLNTPSVFELLTQNNKLELSQDRLIQFLSNIESLSLEDIEIKDYYDYNDLLSLNLDNREFVIKEPLGQKFYVIEGKYLYTVNPFDVLVYDEFLEKYADSTITTLNNDLLLNTFPILNNTIHMCLAEDVITYAQSRVLSVEATIKIYYPFLFKKGIINESQLAIEKTNLIEKTRSILDSNRIDQLNKVAMFYNIYNGRKTELPYSDKGIKLINFILYPDYTFNLPLENIFKLIRATEAVPLIKYNPGNRQEKIYKLYADKIAKNGKKIPFLPKGTIFKLIKLMARQKRVAVYTQYFTEAETIPIICEFDNNGTIEVKIETQEAMMIDKYTEILNYAINPIINVIKTFLQQSGYNINLFKSLFEPNVEILQITYLSNLTITKNVNLSEYIGCISSAFNIINDNLQKGILMRYKRVANYNEMDDINAFITEKLNIGLQNTDIIDDLVQNFSITTDEAEDRVASLLTEFQTERGLYDNKRLRIRNNPGFLTTIKQVPFQSSIIIEVNNIDNINYLDTIPKYIDSILRITQNIDSTRVPKDMIIGLCSKATVETTLLDDIVAPAEQGIEELQTPAIEAQELVFDSATPTPLDQTDADDMLDLLLGDDDEESEQDAAVGGAGSDSSEESSEDSLVEMPMASQAVQPAASPPSSEESSEDSLVEMPMASQAVQPAASPASSEESSEESLVEMPMASQAVPAAPTAAPPTASLESPAIPPVASTVLPVTAPTTASSQDSSEDSLVEMPMASQAVPAAPELTATTESVVNPTLKTEEAQPSDEESEDVPVETTKKTSPFFFRPQADDDNSTPGDVDESTKQEPQPNNTLPPVSSKKSTPNPRSSQPPKTLSFAQQLDEELADVGDFIQTLGLTTDDDDEDAASEKPEEEAVQEEPVQATPVQEEPVQATPVQEEPEQATPVQATPEQATPVQATPVQATPEQAMQEQEEKEEESLETAENISAEEAFIENDGESNVQVESPEMIGNIDGMSLTNPNPIFTRLHNRDSALFLTEDNGKYKQYSRACPSNVKRQPIILTQAEKDKIDRESPGAYDKALKYGSDKGKEYYYICPRYWCLLNNTALTEEDVRNGKCGGQIIPKGSKKVPKGKYILEFNDPKEHQDEQGNYITHNPGFLKSKTEDGKCIPCCFKNWSAPEQSRRRAECSNPDDTTNKPVSASEKENYVKRAEKVPLDPNRWGYLPIAVQKFMHTDNSKCQISHTNNNIKPFTTCILRHGVEISIPQSFIACIADVFIDYIKDKSKISIKEMKQYILNAINIDTFIQYQNGSLTVEFRDDNENMITDIDIELYKESEIYNNLDIDEEGNVFYLQQIINAYQNFIKYMNDDTIDIDYTYLWDIICTPNVKLFPRGLNLVIMYLPNNDITDNLEIICPSNHYSSQFYEKGKSTLFILKSDIYFEPVYAYRDDETRLIITKTFNEFSNQLLPNIRSILDVVNRIYKQNCRPLPSMPRVYKFKKNIDLKLLVERVLKLGYIIKHQVMNYQNKIIGVQIEHPEKKDKLNNGFISCYPSKLDSRFDYIYMDDDKIWNSYMDTISFLLNIKKQDDNILCKPVIKILDDGLIVGIITETNQFIAIDPPSENIFDDGLIVHSGENYFDADKTAVQGKGDDKERKDIIKYVNLESNFYNVFRNSIRILLNESKHRNIRGEIEEIIDNKSLIYTDKLTNVNSLLKKLGESYIKFITYEKEVLDSIENISGCLGSEKDTCSNKQYCMVDSSSICNLLIPKNHLLSGLDNENVYYGRMADEIIRYSRIRYFIFQPREFLNFNEVDYNLWPTEIILLHSLLNQDYFDNLIPMSKNPFIFNNSYDNTDPIITQTYSNVQSLDEIKDPKPLKECIPKRKRNISGKWENKLPSNAFEFIFDATPACSFALMNKIIFDKTGQDIETYILRKLLIEIYNKYMKDYKDQILSVLTAQGKKNMMHQIFYNQITFETLVMSESYYLTNLDIWMLSEYYSLPIIFLSGTLLPDNNDSILITQKSPDNAYYFIKTPGVKHDEASKYRLIGLNDIIYIPVIELPNTMRVLINSIITEQTDAHKHVVDMTEFLTDFKVVERRRKPKKKLENFVIKESDEPDPVIQAPPASVTSQKVGRQLIRSPPKKLQLDSLPALTVPDVATLDVRNIITTSGENPAITEEPTQSVEIPPPSMVDDQSLEISNQLSSQIPIPELDKTTVIPSVKRKKPPKKLTGVLPVMDKPINFAKRSLIKLDQADKPKSI